MTKYIVLTAFAAAVVSAVVFGASPAEAIYGWCGWEHKPGCSW